MLSWKDVEDIYRHHVSHILRSGASLKGFFSLLGMFPNHCSPILGTPKHRYHGNFH